MRSTEPTDVPPNFWTINAILNHPLLFIFYVGFINNRFDQGKKY
jgi:hypothetical protein